MKKPHRIGVYIRVSTDKQAQVFEGSLETQKVRMIEFVKSRNNLGARWGSIIDYYIDEGVSAATENRPQYQRLLSDVRNQRIDLILVADLARLSRNVRDFAGLQAALESLGASVFSMKEQFDTSTPSGRMMINMMISMAQFEREQTSERVSINGHSRAQRGFINGGPAVLGFDRDPEKPGRLVINKQEAESVRIVFKTFLDEGTRSRTIRRLHDMGIYPKSRNNHTSPLRPPRWTVDSLSNVLHHKGYIGLREINKLYRSQDQSTLKPWQQYQTVKASWPAIISESDFLEAQRLLTEAAENQRQRLTGSERRVFYLSNLLMCGECSRALVGSSSHGRDTIYRYYRHSREFNGSVCDRPRLSADLLEEKFISHLRSGLAAAGYGKTLESSIASATADDQKLIALEKAALSKELSQIKKEIAGIWRMQGAGRMDTRALKLASENLNALANRSDLIERRIQEISDIHSGAIAVRKQVSFVEDNLQKLIKSWPKATAGQKKRLLRRAVKQIVVSREEMVVTYWLCAEERDGSVMTDSFVGTNESRRIVHMQRPSSTEADKGVDQNEVADIWPIRGNGSERRT